MRKFATYIRQHPNDSAAYSLILRQSLLKVNKWLFWTFFISIFAPTVLSVQLGSIRLTLYRITLLIFLAFSIPAILKSAKPKLKNPNFYIVIYAIWAALALTVNHGLEMVETSGIYFIEVVGPFFITLAYCNTVKKIQKVVWAYLLTVCLTLLVTLPETLTGFNWLYKTLGSSGTPGAHIGKRMGLHRAFGSFDHPILQGVYAGTAIGLAWFTVKKKFVFIAALVATITSVSSGAIASVFIQFMLIGWETFTKSVTKRWRLLLIILIIIYILIDLISNRPAMRAILTNLTMSPHTAYWRMMIWEYGMDNVWGSPIFGIGHHDWVRPYWMYSGSMDAFWLVSMVRYGLPAFFFYATSFLIVIFGLLSYKSPTKEILLMRRGWLCGMIGLAISSCTVHLWNNAFIFVNFYLGLGAAMLIVFRRESKMLKMEQLKQSDRDSSMQSDNKRTDKS